MKARSAAIQGGLAIVGLVAAYVTWQRPKETSKAESVVIADASKNSLEKVRYEDGTRYVELEKRDRFTVGLGFLEGKRPVFDAGMAQVAVASPDAGSADGGVDAGTVLVNVKPPEPPPDRVLFANDRADTIWAKLTPFEGSRALGQLSKEKLDEVGLTGSERKLELTIAGVKRTFTISRPVSGLIGNYAQDQKSNDVFVIGSSLFNDLDPNSQVLVDRRLHLFKQGEFDAFTVKGGGKEAAFVQSGGDIPQTAKVARAATPDKADELAKNWHDKIWNRLIVTEVLAANENPKAGPVEVQLRLEYTLKGKSKGWLELGWDDTKGTWARSENTPGWVSVHQGSEEIIIEGQKQIVGN
ncbi:MAG: hypothetical protein U0228_24360 [Myxococcaceae bacterium]